MSVTNAIDYKKVGYRWKGEYNTATSYENNDVVHKEGAAWKFNSSSGNFEIFARGNIDALLKGEIITGGNYSTTGVAGEVLQVDSTGTFVEFNHRMDRNGQRCISLGSHGGDYRMGRLQESGYYSGHFLMNDGTVRVAGYEQDASLGVGNTAVDVGGTPAIVPFPKGIRIKKIFRSRAGAFYIDQYDRLWTNGYYEDIPVGGSYTSIAGAVTSSNYLELPVCVHEVLPNVFTANDKIVAVVGFYDFYSGYRNHFAFSDVGKVWVWGDNTGGELGQGNTSQVLDAVLLEFTNDVPMQAVTCAPWGGYAGLKAVNNDYYVCGSGDANWLGSNVYRFQKLEMAGKIRYANIESTLGHWTNYPRYYNHTIVLENGDVYNVGNNPGQVGWGHYGDTTSFTTNNSPHTIGSRSSLLATGVRKAYTFSGGYNQLLVQVESDGHWRHRGYTGYRLGSQTQANSQPLHQQDFMTNPLYKMDPQYYHNNITKFIWWGYNIFHNHAILDNQGRLAVFGSNNVGQCGHGWASASGHIGAASYYTAGGSTGDDPFGSANVIKPEFLYLPHPETWVDIEPFGRKAYQNGSAYHDDGWYALTNKGDVYAWGNSGFFNFMNGNVDQYTPAKVIF